MSDQGCISNRNIKIIAAYVTSITGSHHFLFNGLPYPNNEYDSAETFFLNEHEWTSYTNFNLILRRAQQFVPEPNFYFSCGASSARLRSWGRLHYFAKIFSNPDEAFKRLPFFNKNFNETKEIELISPPALEPGRRKTTVTLKIRFLDDFDPNIDYIGESYLRGIISSIPTIWGLPPASIKNKMMPYDPEVLFNTEPEFSSYRLDVKIKEKTMEMTDPASGKRLTVGVKVMLEPAKVNGHNVFMGKYTMLDKGDKTCTDQKNEAILITKTVKAGDMVLVREGDIYKAPYSILDISYNRISLKKRIAHIFNFNALSLKHHEEELVETIDLLRKSMRAKNRAFGKLENTNAELEKTKRSLDEYARKLEQKVEERTIELRKAKEDLIRLNRDLKSKVKKQVFELERYNQIRRYLSPKLTQEILTKGETFAIEPKRKMITVVFTDIRRFSSITDSLESEELFHLLNTYISAMIKIAHQYDGTLNKILGDGLIIFFGDPIFMEDQAERAVLMAIDMQKKSNELKDEWVGYGHELGIGIGINTGYMTVGNIGSDIHRDYTVIGNQVNVAARLESEAKAGQILISRRTYSRIKNIVEVDDMGEIQVKGIYYPVRTYSVKW